MPHYTDDDGRRSVALIDDRYTFGKEPEDEFVFSVVTAIGKQDLMVLARDALATVDRLIVPANAEYNADVPAPSAWILDIELQTGSPIVGDVGDGIGLARYIRGLNITRPNDRNEHRPIPILFLSRFDLGDVHATGVDPMSARPIRDRIRMQVQSAWRYFRKDFESDEARIQEQSINEGEVREYSVDEFAKLVRRAAYGA